MSESNDFLQEAEFMQLRNRVQSILKTGTQAWGEASTFAEMSATPLNAILEAFFPAPASDAVVLDVGSGLGNFPFRAALYKNTRSIGIEFNRDCHLQTVQLLQEIIQNPLLSSNNLASRMQFIYGDANQITSLEGVTHLYMFNKNMPQSIFTNLAPVANECSSLQVVLSHYDLRKLGWTGLELVETFASKLTGSGESVKTLMYKVAPTKKTARTEPRDGIIMGSYLRRMEQFKSWPLQKVLGYWDEDLAKVDVTGTKFVADEVSGLAVRRSQRQPGRGAALEDFVRRSLPSDLVKFEDLQARWKKKQECQSSSKKVALKAPQGSKKVYRSPVRAPSTKAKPLRHEEPLSESSCSGPLAGKRKRKLISTRIASSTKSQR